VALLTFNELVFYVENWIQVLIHYVVPTRSLSELGNPFVVCLRNGKRLIAPPQYSLEDIAETLLLNSYRASPEYNYCVDIGASSGDFILQMKSKNSHCVIFAFETSRENFKLLLETVKLNNLFNVICYNIPANAKSIISLLKNNPIPYIDLLKCDCDGCELFLYDLPDHIFAKIKRIHMEIHGTNTARAQLAYHIRQMGYIVDMKKSLICPFANGCDIDTTASTRIIIGYTPENLVTYAVLVSCVTLVLSLVILGRDGIGRILVRLLSGSVRSSNRT